jgi:hypothetical protein
MCVCHYTVASRTRKFNQLHSICVLRAPLKHSGLHIKCFLKTQKSTLFYAWFYSTFIIPLLQGIWAPFATNFLYPLPSLAHIYLVNTFLHILNPRLVSSFPHPLSFSPFFSLLKEEQWKIGNVLRNVNHLATTTARLSAEKWEWWGGWQISEGDERAVDLSKVFRPTKMQKVVSSSEMLFSVCLSVCLSACLPACLPVCLYLYTKRVLYITHAHYNIKRRDI